MANQQTEVLRALSSKEEGVGPSLLAPELRTSEANVRTYLNRLKKKGYVDGGGSSWYITDAGRKALETGEEIPTSVEDVGEDELSKFTYYGQLAGVEPNLITAAVELFKNADTRSMDEVDRVLAEVNIPMTHRPRWRSLYLGYLRNTTPPEKKDELYPLPKLVPRLKGEETTSSTDRLRGEVRDCIVEGTNVLRVGEDMGMFTFKEALQAVAAKRGTEGGGAEGIKALADAMKTLNPNQPLTVETLLDLADRLKPSGGGGNPAQDGYIDEDGNWKPLQPGQRVIVIKKEAPPTSGKQWIIRHTPQGTVKESYEPGEPIIIETVAPAAGGSSMPPMMPFPVIGSDGKPVVDQDGHPVYANIEPMMRWMGFQGEQRRADERHQTLMGLAQTVRESIPDGVQALIHAVEETRAKGGTGAPKQETPPTTPQTFECGKCKTQFTLPTTEAWTQLKCPGCGYIWTKEEVMKV